MDNIYLFVLWTITSLFVLKGTGHILLHKTHLGFKKKI